MNLITQYVCNETLYAPISIKVRVWVGFILQDLDPPYMCHLP